MKNSLLCMCLAASLPFSLPAVAAPLDDQIAAFQKAVKKEVTRKQKEGGPNGPDTGTAFLYVASMRDWNSLDANNVEELITQAMTAVASDEVQQTGTALLAAIRAQRKEREDVYIASVDGVVKQLPDLLTKATKPAELDKALADLQALQDSTRANYGTRTQGASEQARSAYRFVSNWQDYLSNIAAGRMNEAKNNLRNMADNDFGSTIVPRSSLLDRLRAIESPDESGGSSVEASPQGVVMKIVAAVNDPDQAREALSRLRKMSESQEAIMGVSQLNAVINAYDNVNAGMPSANINFDNLSWINADFRAKILMFLMEHYFDSPALKVQPGETPPAYAARVLADATARGDWQLLGKALNVQNFLSRGAQFGNFANVNSSGLDSLIAGLNQDSAGQFSLAVVSYQAALKAPNQYVPAKMIGERLTAIQKEHPKEFEAGMQMVLSPPVPRYYMAGYPGQNPQGYPPGYPNARQIPQPNMPVPAATPEPSPTVGPVTIPEASASPKAKGGK